MKVDFTLRSTWRGNDVLSKVHEFLDKSVYEVGLAAESQAKVLAPVDEGRLKGSITTQMRGKGTDIQTPSEPSDKIQPPDSSMVAHVGTNVVYAAINEFGGASIGINHPAQPYLRPALDYANGQSLHIMGVNGKAELKDYL